MKRYTAFLCRRPGLVMLAAMGVFAPSLWLATKLELRTDFKDLLPKQRRSVVEMDRIGAHVGGLASLAVAVEIPKDQPADPAALKRFCDDLSERLRALPPGLVDHVEDTVKTERAFFEKYGWLYASVEDLLRAQDVLEARVIAETPFHLGLDEEGTETAKPGTSAPPAAGTQDSEIKKLERDLRAKVAPHDRFPDGYYIGENGHLLAMWVYAAPATDVDANQRLVDRVRFEADALNPASYNKTLRITLTGDILTAHKEYEALKGDIFLASGLCISLVLLVIVLFYGRLRSLWVLGAALAMGVGVTFGFARLAIGYLNSSTAFLGSIVAGNGINFGIIMLARYFEERRRGLEVDDAVDIAVRRTAAATAGAALAASIAYGSLMITDFRGFNQFGVIGGFGMAICWLASYTVGPAMIVLSERIPLLAGRTDRPWRDLFSKPFAFLVRRIPRTLVGIACVVTVVGVALTVRFIAHDPFEYDFGNLNNKARTFDYATEMGGRVWQIRGPGAEGLVLLAERPDQIPLIKQALEERKRAEGPASPIGGVHSVEDLLPDKQDEKLALLHHISNVVGKVRNLLEDDELALADKYRPPGDLHPIRQKDLPKKATEGFTERDGTIGRVVFIETAPGLNTWNGHDLMHLAKSVEELKLSNGETVYTSGQAVIFADMLRSVLADGPRAVLCSLGGVLILIVVMMRKPRASALTLGALLSGVAVMLAAAALLGMKLNFLNFVAIPITIGVGADYAINIVRRHLDEPELMPDEVVARTGGAVTLCSLTTTIGYGALLAAANRALISFGMLAMLGEVTCLVTGVVLLPALLRLLRLRRDARRIGADVLGPDAAPYARAAEDARESHYAVETNGADGGPAKGAGSHSNGGGRITGSG